MKEKINIAKILKDKPKGTKLYSPICGECKLSYIESEKIEPQISTESDAFGVFYFWDDGKAYNEGECLLFPSNKMRDWAKFSWKKGDVLKNNAYEERVIFDGFLNDDYTYFKGKHPLDCSDKFNIAYHEECNCFTGNYRLESTDAAQNYINTIEERLGGNLNSDTLEIENAHPEFKDGDIVAVDLDRKIIRIFKEKKNENNICWGKYYIGFSFNNDGKLIQTFKNYTAGCSSDRLATDSEKQQLFSALEKKGKRWDSDKKSIVDLNPKVELKPFDKVLVRDYDNEIWHANLFSNYMSEGSYGCVCSAYKQCVPYEGNEYLLGTKNNPK